MSLVSTCIWAKLPWVYFYFDFACILRARAFAENWLLVLLLGTSFSITREISGTSQEIFQRSRNRKCLETSLQGNVRDPPRKCLGSSKEKLKMKRNCRGIVCDHPRKCLGLSKKSCGRKEIVEELSGTIQAWKMRTL